MHKKFLFLTITAIVFCSFVLVGLGFCYQVPGEQSNVKYLYTFGKDGQKTYGAMKTGPLVIFVRVPSTYNGNIQIGIYDPDTGGAIDEKDGQWDTITKFSILGGKKTYTSLLEADESHVLIDKESDTNPVDPYHGDLLAEKTFGNDEQYDKKIYSFDPIDASKGEEAGGYRYFKIVIEGLSGNDNNLFSLDISPDTLEAFSFAPRIRLAETRGAKMAFYPEIPSDSSRIYEYNYDLDPTGGTIDLISASRDFRIKGSATGMWESTEIKVPSQDAGKRWVYEITKDRQKQGNMAFSLLTDKGRSIPIYFTPGAEGPKLVFVEKPKETPAPTGQPLSCNTFTFDGSKSYAADNSKLAYFWDFGDGTTSTDMRIMHTYKDAGKYLVKLTVKDASDAECNTADTQQMVKVNQPPCAIADGPDLSCLNEEITFDGSQTTDSPDDKLTYRWDFGDGQTADGIKVKHKYARGGNYQATLTVTDDSGTICDTSVDKIKVGINTPPTADAGKDTFICSVNPSQPLDVAFDAAGSKDQDGDKLTYTWDFGDGQTGEGRTVKHTYAKGGEYIAKLIVSDNTDTECDKAVSTKTVVLNRAPIANAGNDLQICTGDTASFDASGSTDNDGDRLSYAWDFGDGEKAEGKTVSHKYTKGGVYQVKLIVDDGAKTDCSSASDKLLVNVNTAPSAIIASKDTASVGQTVNFDSANSNDLDGDKLGYTWDFGDGTSASGSAAKHSYSKGGLYKVTLVVDDQKRTDCSSAINSQYVKVNTPPAAVTGPNLIACVGDEIEFDGSKSTDLDGDKLTYRWDFGDGETAEGLKVKHAYKKLGTYKVSLMVTDDSGVEGNSSTSSLMATIHDQPVSKIEVM
ncbi:MAG: PKD domain-containing protein [Candidatus Omnitrophota bacterium]|nr:PKD domain-containing protein [Candidatus Omnitrophota bacterium]